MLTYIEESKTATDQKPTKRGSKKQQQHALTIEDDPQRDGPGFDIPDSAEISGKQIKFVHWKKGLYTELFAYVEPSRFSRAVEHVDSLALAKQLMTFAWDVNCFDSARSDKCTTRKKKDLFERLRLMYNSLGRCLSNITMQDGFVDWAEQGHYGLEDLRTEMGRHVRVFDSIQKKIASVPSDMLVGSSTTFCNKDIIANYSYADAHITLADDGQLVLSSLFPKARRNLSRRISEELGAVEVQKTGVGKSAASAKDGQDSSGSGGKKRKAPARAQAAGDTKSAKKARTDDNGGASGSIIRRRHSNKTTVAARPVVGKGRSPAQPPSPTPSQIAAAGASASSGSRAPTRSGAARRPPPPESCDQGEGEDEDMAGGESESPKAGEEITTS